MRAVITIALNNLKNQFKSPVFWGILILFPIAELFLFSSVFSNIPLPASQTLVKITQINPVDNSFGFNRLVINILGQFFLIGSVVASSYIINERENKTLMRALTLPLTKTQLYTGYLLGIMIQLLIVISLIMLISSLLFGISWSPYYLDLGIVTVLCVFLCSSFGFLISTIFKNSNLAGGIMSGVVILMSFINGDMTSGKLLFRNSNLFTINKWITEAYLKLNQGFRLKDTLLCLSVIIALGLIFMFSSIFLFRKEKMYE